MTKQLLAVHVLRLCTHIKLYQGIPSFPQAPVSFSFICSVVETSLLTGGGFPTSDTETEHSARDGKVCVYKGQGEHLLGSKVRVTCCCCSLCPWLLHDKL